MLHEIAQILERGRAKVPWTPGDPAVGSASLMVCRFFWGREGLRAAVELPAVAIPVLFSVMAFDGPFVGGGEEAVRELTAVVKTVEVLVVCFASRGVDEGLCARLHLAAPGSAVLVGVMVFDVPAAGKFSLSWLAAKETSERLTKRAGHGSRLNEGG